MMVATLQLKAPKLIVYFVSFTVVIFTILKIFSCKQGCKSVSSIGGMISLFWWLFDIGGHDFKISCLGGFFAQSR